MTSIGVIGAGKIGGSLLTRLAESGNFELGVSDVHAEYLKPYSERYGMYVTDSNVDLVKRSDIVVVAVKPWDVGPVMESISPAIEGTEKAVASVAAGVTIGSISEKLPPGTPVLRVMPNVCASVGLGSAVVTANEAGQEYLPMLMDMFGYVGEVME
ncbi:MAG: NAD(P)-binding domain-containing protein, partial [Rubrobacteraceae bacterium]